jgi:DnaJ-class molecular chaperone
MAKKEVQTCPSCNGAGGWWEPANGKDFKNRRWRTCPVCKGAGTT